MTWRSGFCGLTNPEDSHAQCRGSWQDKPCGCDCHTATTEPLKGDTMEPGLVHDMDDETYHADPIPGGSLSSTFARLLTEYVPAKARALASDTKVTAAMEFGSLMHRVQLGFESPDDYAVNGLILIEGDGRTKAVKEAKARAVAAGYLPVGRPEYDERTELHAKINGMVEALANHAEGSALINSGKAEVSAFWQDEETGVWCRARFDVLPDDTSGTLLKVPDYKTCIDASRRGFQKAIAKRGYHQQADFYERAIRALGIHKNPRFRFVAQESAEPYLVNVHHLDSEARETARVLNDRALRIYAQCKATGEWPGYPLDPDPLALPAFYFYDHEEVLSA